MYRYKMGVTLNLPKSIAKIPTSIAVQKLNVYKQI
jgi:hypothetical protein